MLVKPYTNAQTALVRFDVDLCKLLCKTCRQQTKPVEFEHHRAHIWYQLSAVSLCSKLQLQPFYKFTALSGTTRVSRYQKKHSPTLPIVVMNHSLSPSSIFYDSWHPPCSMYLPDSLFPQSLQVFFGLTLSPPHSIHFFTQ